MKKKQKTTLSRMEQIRSAHRDNTSWAERMAKSAMARGVLIHDGMGTLAPEIRTFFEEAIHLSPGPAPFEGYTSEELDRLYAEIAAEPCFAAKTDEAGC